MHFSGIYSVLAAALASSVAGERSFFIVRCGDKASVYDWYDIETYGNNPPLTECGREQSRLTASWLAQNVSHVVLSPYLRALTSALPIAELLNVPISVEQGLTVGRNTDTGHFRPNNALASGNTKVDLEAALARFNEAYGSKPCFTPESTSSYHVRCEQTSLRLLERFPEGNVAVVTHGSPAFSLAYGLCFRDTGTDEDLEAFIRGQAANPMSGVMEVVLNDDGSCREIKQTRNIPVEQGLDCGENGPSYCPFDYHPDYYWKHALGEGEGRCPTPYVPTV